MDLYMNQAMSGGTNMVSGSGLGGFSAGLQVISTCLLIEYSLEQQASIIADYWLILVYGMDTWLRFQDEGKQGRYRGNDNFKDIPYLYKKIITGRE